MAGLAPPGQPRGAAFPAALARRRWFHTQKPATAPLAPRSPFPRLPRAKTSSPRASVNFEYHALPRLTRKKHAITLVASYTCDAAPANNALGSLITEKDGDFGANVDKTEYTYDAEDLRVKKVAGL